ncbi:MAG: isoprenyl transferase [Nitrospinota bacterium]
MSAQDLLTQIDPNKLPRHIAIIMDGNGRWARSRRLPRIAGHREGVRSVDEVVTACRELGVGAVTLYAFSEENWNRPSMEIRALWSILQEYLRREIGRMMRQSIRFRTIGAVESLPKGAQRLIQECERQSAENDAMVLTLALSYGSRQEIVRAATAVAEAVRRRELEPADIAQHFEGYLYTADLPDPDLLIRTSGELRISNFLLWQLAYTELYFTEVLWPDFRRAELYRAILEYQSRERRFGLTREQLLPHRRVEG